MITRPSYLEIKLENDHLSEFLPEFFYKAIKIFIIADFV
jgi:hypothetical protein